VKHSNNFRVEAFSEVWPLPPTENAALICSLLVLPAESSGRLQEGLDSRKEHPPVSSHYAFCTEQKTGTKITTASFQEHLRARVVVF